MKQSTLSAEPGSDAGSGRPTGLHVAVIMDGNGRWAAARGLPRTFGHREGTKSLRRVVEAAPGLGVGTLTLYAFSSDNWKRPPTEVSTLMRLFHRHLRGEVAELEENGVRLKVIGRRDRLPPQLLRAVDDAESTTAQGDRLLLRLAIDYSARDALVAAARSARDDGGDDLDRDALARHMGRVLHDRGPVPDVDLLIRTGGEQRLSDFLLWEAAYAELYFTDVMWPDFGRDELVEAVAEFRRRERRFGQVVATEPAVDRAAG